MQPKDPLIQETLFLRFASRKEFLRHYRAKDSTTALAQWAVQHQLSPSEAAARLLEDGGAVALFGQQAVLGLRPRRRTAPYGYTRRDGRLVRKAEEARTVATFFRMYDGGMSLRQIAEAANRRGVPTSRGGRWQASTIQHMLRNPTYIGRVRRKGMVREGGPPGLIDSELFEMVQRGLTLRAKRANEAMREGSLPPPV